MVRNTIKVNKRKVTRQITEYCTQKKYIHNIVLMEEDPLYRLCNKEGESASD